MNNFLRFCLIIFGTSAITLGCKKNGLDDAFLKPGRVYDMAIEGGFNTYTVYQYIRLTRPALHRDSVPSPIRKAFVVVNDSRTNIVYNETNVPGVYMGASRNDPNYNQAYTLTVKYNGKTYTAVDTLRQVVNIIDDFLPLSTHLVQNDVIKGTIPKHTFGYLNPNKWYISYLDVPSWNPADFDQNRYYSYTHLLGSPNSLYPLNNLKRSFTLGGDDVISIYKISLSESYARYLYSVFMETDWNGLFSGVPVNVQGNVSGNVQGYFSVSDIDVRRYKAREL